MNCNFSSVVFKGRCCARADGALHLHGCELRSDQRYVDWVIDDASNHDRVNIKSESEATCIKLCVNVHCFVLVVLKSCSAQPMTSAGPSGTSSQECCSSRASGDSCQNGSEHWHYLPFPRSCIKKIKRCGDFASLG